MRDSQNYERVQMVARGWSGAGSSLECGASSVQRAKPLSLVVVEEEVLSGLLLLGVLHRVLLVDARPEIVRISSEGD